MFSCVVECLLSGLLRLNTAQHFVSITMAAATTAVAVPDCLRRLKSCYYPEFVLT
jgi:hypothetical protein